jgi:hypothetical protein
MVEAARVTGHGDLGDWTKYFYLALPRQRLSAPALSTVCEIHHPIS